MQNRTMQDRTIQNIEDLLTQNKRSVHKFGGTSMANFEAMQRSAQVVLPITGPLVIVVSAAATVTRALMHLSHHNTPLQEQAQLIQDISRIHQDILAKLVHPEVIQPAVDALLREVKQRHAALQIERTLAEVDALLSIGERLSSLVFSQVLVELGRDAVWFDVRDVMKTSNHHGEAEPLLSEIKARAETSLSPLSEQKIVVTQGYIGATLEGATTTLGKESSDYSAALLAEALRADYFAIWTDIPGVFTTDPKITAAARPIQTISMQNALALTEAGAKVLHPRTMLPALRAGLAFFVGSSQGAGGGTWVLSQREDKEKKAEVVAISLRQEQILLSFDHSPANLIKGRVSAHIMAYLDEAEIKPAFVYADHLSTEILLDDSLREFRRESILTAEHSQNLQVLAPISTEMNLQLIAIIGNRLDQHEGLRKILAAFIKHYKIRVLSFGMSSHTLFMLVHETLAVAKELVVQLQQELFE